MTRLAILGSTGSIGLSALEVVAAHADRLDVVGLAAGVNAAAMRDQVAQLRPRVVAMATDEAVQRVRAAVPADVRASVSAWASGRTGLVEVATHPDVDIVLCACSGTEALEAVLAAIEAGKRIALANKEVLVMAGALVMAAARARGVEVLPVDSEHNAIHQCLAGHPRGHVRRLVLTASGGPFRTTPVEALATVTAADALSHPTWKMGRKITVDSATMMNKGLEVIEARWLFDMPADRIDVVIHPQSVVHSMVEFEDGSLLAQLGVTDMKLPIQYAFTWPDRWASPVPRLDWQQGLDLRFEAPDLSRFPCLRLAYEALRAGGAAPVVLNAANEIAVASFLEGHVPFTGIAATVGEVLAEASGRTLDATSLAAIRDVDAWARQRAAARLGTIESGRGLIA
ncbi:MAG TPA: 1-deoxy-D-xylulose-5-phosphate reductoisomerase [Gemmatimonadales bacterium]|nr:1-deoxy-D-xylulose-5-phosphate reductoisomerase [Gemmatimonadales bacterium]